MKLTIVTGIEDHSLKTVDNAIKQAVSYATCHGIDVVYRNLPEFAINKYKELVNLHSLINPSTMGRPFLDTVETIRALGYQAIKAEILESKLSNSLPDQVIIYTPATIYNIAVCSEFMDASIKMLAPDRFVTIERDPGEILGEYLAKLNDAPDGEVDHIRQLQWLASNEGDQEVYRNILLQDMEFWQGRELSRTAKWSYAYGKAGSQHICYMLGKESTPAQIWTALTGDNQ
jgi:hypothetical protein